MPTSDFNQSRDALVRRALRKLGDTNPDATAVSVGVDALNSIVKRIDVQGKWLWAISNTETQLTITNGTKTYATGTVPAGLAPDILSIETFALMIGGQHQQLRILEKPESLVTYDLDRTGQPLSVYLEKQPLLTNNKIWVYPVPSGTFSAVYTYRRRLYDFDNVGDNPDFPQEWLDCLTYQLAAELIPEYNTAEPLASRIEQRAQGLMKLMKEANSDISPQATTVTTTYF